STASLTPYLWPSSLVVSRRVCRIHVLIGHEGVRRFFGKSLGYFDVMFRRTWRDVSGSHHYAGPVGLEEASFLLAHLVGHREDHLVAFDTCCHREPGTRSEERRVGEEE